MSRQRIDWTWLIGILHAACVYCRRSVSDICEWCYVPLACPCLCLVYRMLILWTAYDLRFGMWTWNRPMLFGYETDDSDLACRTGPVCAVSNEISAIGVAMNLASRLRRNQSPSLTAMAMRRQTKMDRLLPTRSHFQRPRANQIETTLLKAAWQTSPPVISRGNSPRLLGRSSRHRYLSVAKPVC